MLREQLRFDGNVQDLLCYLWGLVQSANAGPISQNGEDPGWRQKSVKPCLSKRPSDGTGRVPGELHLVTGCRMREGLA